MKSITTLTNQITQQQRSGEMAQSPRENPREINEAAARHVNDIFRALQAAFPAWRQAFPDDGALKAAKASWVKGLIEAGITDLEQIARGVRKARQSQSDFFPSVGKFIHWCKPSLDELGLPSPVLAYHEAGSGAGRIFAHRWSHPGVYEAARRCGLWDLRRGAISEKVFAGVYQEVCQDVMRGAAFELPELRGDRLEHLASGDKTPTEEQKALAREALAALKRMVR